MNLPISEDYNSNQAAKLPLTKYPHILYPFKYFKSLSQSDFLFKWFKSLEEKNDEKSIFDVLLNSSFYYSFVSFLHFNKDREIIYEDKM